MEPAIFLEYLGIFYSGKWKHEQNIKNSSLKRLQGTGGKALEWPLTWEQIELLPYPWF